MASNVPYDDPKFGASNVMVITRSPTTSNPAGEVLARIQNFVDMKVLEVRAIVRTASASASSAIGIYKGAALIGTIAIGTSPVGTTVDAELTDTNFDKDTDILSFQQVVYADIGTSDIIVQWQENYESA